MKLCCVFNYNPHYRLPIYQAIDKVFEADFFFGDKLLQPIKQFDPNLLKGFKNYINLAGRCFVIFNRYSNTSAIFNKKYTHYIITGDSNMLVNWRILIYSHIFGKKVFIWGHGEHKRIEKLRYRIMQRMFYKLSTGVLLYQEYARPFMHEVGCSDKKLYYIHNSLDTPKQTEIYNKLVETSIYKDHFQNCNPTIIYIGRIQKVKKVNQIIEAQMLLKKQGFDVNVVFVGQNIDVHNFDEIIKQSGLSEQIWIYGASYSESINAELIYNAHALVSPGNVGLSCIHSLSYGTPVITNDNYLTQMPEHGAIEEGVTGSFFKEDDVRDFASKIQYWCSLSAEQKVVTRRRARNMIKEQWSIDYQIELLKKVLE